MAARFVLNPVAAFCLVACVSFSHAQWVKTNGPDSVRAFTDGWVTLEEGARARALFAGTNNGVFRSLDDGDTWVATNEGLTSLHVRSLRIYRDTILAATEGGGLFRSGNGGISWTSANTGLTNLNTHSISLIEAMYVGTASGGVFKTPDRGMSWDSIGVGSTRATVTSVEHYLNALYVGTSGDGVFSSADDGTTWSATNTGLANLTVNAMLNDASYLYAATGEGVYALRFNIMSPGWRQEDFGVAVPPPVNALASPLITTDIPVHILAGTQGSGVYLLNPHTATWTMFNAGLTDLDVHTVYATATVTYIATNGGVWRRATSEVMEHTSVRGSAHGEGSTFRVHDRVVAFGLDRPARVTLTAFAMDGREVTVLMARTLPSGRHSLHVDEEALPSGLYVYRLRIGGRVESRRVLVY